MGMVGSACQGARLAGMSVLVTTVGGRLLEGIPSVQTAPSDGTVFGDETGYLNELNVDGVDLGLDEVQAVVLVRPV